MSVRKYFLISSLIVLITSVFVSAEVKSLYLVGDHNTAQFDAYEINPDGTVTGQVSYNLVYATDPAGIGIWVEPGKEWTSIGRKIFIYHEEAPQEKSGQKICVFRLFAERQKYED